MTLSPSHYWVSILHVSRVVELRLTNCRSFELEQFFVAVLLYYQQVNCICISEGNEGAINGTLNLFNG